MNGPFALPRLHVVTDDNVLARRSFVDAAAAALEAGGGEVALHLRGPGTGGGALLELASELRRLAAGESVPFLAVNDRVDVALAARMRPLWVHLGARSLPPGVARRLLEAHGGPVPVVVGASTHSASEAREAFREGADYIFFGSVFETASHPGRKPVGLDGLAEAVAAIRPMGPEESQPVVAIGGMTPERVASVLAAGARGVAVVTGVWNAPDPAGAVREYLEALGASPGAVTGTAQSTKEKA
ncbi:MAG: thiamine phosphate synthase [Gemmatimonadota bacterium]